MANITNITNMTEKMSPAELLRAIRGSLNLTQEQIADRLGVSFATINRWEGGSNVPQKAAREVIAALALEAGVAGLDDADGEAAATATPAAEVTRRRRGKAAIGSHSTKSMEQ